MARYVPTSACYVNPFVFHVQVMDTVHICRSHLHGSVVRHFRFRRPCVMVAEKRVLSSEGSSSSAIT